MSVKVILFTSKKLKNGECPIMLRVIKDRKTSYRSIGFSCKKEWWDVKEGKPNKKHPNKVELEALISKKVSEANRLIMKLELDDKGYSSTEVAERSKKKSYKITVFTFFDEVVERLKKANQIGNANAYKDAKRALSKFRNTKDLTFAEIDYNLLTKFEESLLENDVTENSICVYMRTIRALYNRAINEDCASIENYPFRKYKISKFNTQTRKRALTKEQIKSIEHVNLKEDSSLWHSRNYFMFSYYTRGINLVDMAYLTKENLENGRLKYRRAKTGKEYNIKLLAPAEEILKSYLALPESKYIFPILNEAKHRTAQQKDDRITKISRQVNYDLKDIMAKVEIDIPVTFYVARHSWATVLKRSGVSVSVISEAMQHDTERTTQVYLDSFDNDVLDEADKNLL